MAGSFTTSAGSVTVSFDYTKPTQFILNVLNNAASFLHEKGFGKDNSLTALSVLTNQNKVDIIDTQVRRSILDLARQNIHDTKFLAAQLDAGSAGSSVDL